MTCPPPDPTSSAPVGTLGAVRGSGAVDPTDIAESEVDSLRQQVAQLQVALATRPLIDQAKGMLMQRYLIDDEEAFQVLTRLSMAANVKLRVIAGGMVRLFGGPCDLPEPDAAVTEILTMLWERELPQPGGARTRTDRAPLPPASESTSTCVSVRPGTGHDVVALTGELDLCTAPQLSPVIHGLLAQGRNRITIDLDDVTFVDWFTIEMLLTAYRDVERTGGSLDITRNPLCARLMALTGTPALPHP